ncbi:MAG: primosomal protein N' [Candidatus Cloacimonetes bacterium]|nr:primosomal protein N' [Candidatus Cloacimonadota bacterium]
MYYYNIALPIALPKLFTYRSQEAIGKGCRVIVRFSHSIYTGIVWDEVFEPDPQMKYRDIMETIDPEALLPPDLMELAEWMSRYYRHSIGLALAAMLPPGFNVNIQLQARRCELPLTYKPSESESAIINLLSADDWLDIVDLKKKLPMKNLQFRLEKIEDDGLIEIRRIYDSRIKDKYANFILLNPEVKSELGSLTPRQQELYDIVRNSDRPVALARLADKFSYSLMKNLVKRGLLIIRSQKIKEEPIIPEILTKQKDRIILTSSQQQVCRELLESLKSKQYATYLLHGITGSGKTEVYLDIISHCLEQGKTALLLVPEIALTPQMVSRFFAAFGEQTAVLHSHLNDRERWQQWRNIRAQRSRIVIGARSAVFAPLSDLGIIIVDEEHENSYKQENIPRYQGRDLAVVRARSQKALCLLGSATPSLESWYNVKIGKYRLLEMKERPPGTLLPEVKVIDLRNSGSAKLPLSPILIEQIANRLQQKEQVILLQNRRGHSSFVQCINCGKLFECDQCDISLNYHSYSQELVCHYCGKSVPLPRKCPDCGSYLFNFGAPGTQQVEKHLKLLFPEARILRMDSDSTRKRDSYDSMFERMRAESIDILLGTQMIAKGLDFANVTLVGVISADIGLNIPDFRAAERTFQLLTQVAGRSGRGYKPGQVYIQTYNPEHYAIHYAMDQNYRDFAIMELDLRERLQYPPYTKMARFIFSHTDEKFLQQQLISNQDVIMKLKQRLGSQMPGLLGPGPAPLTRIQNKFRYHLLLRSNSVEILALAAGFLQDNFRFSTKIKIQYDMDPGSLL